MTSKADYILKAMRLAQDFAHTYWANRECATADDEAEAQQALEDHLTEKLDELLLAAYADGRQDAIHEQTAKENPGY